MEPIIIGGGITLGLAVLGFISMFSYRFGVANTTLAGLDKDREQQQRVAAELKLENAELAKGHLDLVRRLSHIEGMLGVLVRRGESGA